METEKPKQTNTKPKQESIQIELRTEKKPEQVKIKEHYDEAMQLPTKQHHDVWKQYNEACKQAKKQYDETIRLLNKRHINSFKQYKEHDKASEQAKEQYQKQIQLLNKQHYEALKRCEEDMQIQRIGS